MEGPDHHIKVTGFKTLWRKYVLSWVTPVTTLIIIYFLVPPSFGVIPYLMVIIALGIGFFYAFLSEVSYDKDFVILGKKKISFNDVISIKTFSLNNIPVFIIKYKEIGKKKRALMTAGSGSFFSIITAFLGRNKEVNRVLDFIKYAEYRISENEMKKSVR